MNDEIQNKMNLIIIIKLLYLQFSQSRTYVLISFQHVFYKVSNCYIYIILSFFLFHN